MHTLAANSFHKLLHTSWIALGKHLCQHLYSSPINVLQLSPQDMHWIPPAWWESPAVERTARCSVAISKAPAHRGSGAIPAAAAPARGPQPLGRAGLPTDLPALLPPSSISPGDAGSPLQTALGAARDRTRRVVKREQEIPEGSSASEVVLLLAPSLWLTPWHPPPVTSGGGQTELGD